MNRQPDAAGNGNNGNNGNNDNGGRILAVTPTYRRADSSVAVPGSKSIANRALLLAGFADGTSTLTGLPDSDDIQAALGALAALGVPAESPEPGNWRVSGGGRCRSGTIDVRSSGTVGRFLPGLLAAQPDGEWVLRATLQLAARPMEPLLAALTSLGGRAAAVEAGKSFPCRVRGGGLAGGHAEISAARSSQFASGLILAAPLAGADTEILVTDVDPEEAYLDLTLSVMRRFGVKAESTKTGSRQRIQVPAGQRYRSTEFSVEADYNSALYFLCLPLIAGGRLRVTNLLPDSGQPGRKFLSVISRLGGTVTEDADGVKVRATGGPLRGGFEIDMRAMSEMALTLGVLAVFADSPVTMTNLAHIRGHETDRLAVLERVLGQFGVLTEAGVDWIRVHPLPARELSAPAIDSHGDHRVAMSFALLGAGGNGVAIRNPEAVEKTFPDFFRRLAGTGAADCSISG